MGKIFTSGIIAVGIVATVLGFNYDKPEKVELMEVDASWDYEPQSIDEMYELSDLVVVGKVKEEIGTIQPFTFDESVIYTEIDFKVNTFLKGETSKHIPVVNYGGTSPEGKVIEWHGIEKINKDKLYLLFLEKLETEDDRNNKYRPISGIAGTYEVSKSNGKEINKLVKEENLSIDDLEGYELKVQEPMSVIQNTVIEAGMEGVIDSKERLKSNYNSNE